MGTDILEGACGGIGGSVGVGIEFFTKGTGEVGGEDGALGVCGS